MSDELKRLTEDELAALPAPPRSLYRTQADGEMVRVPFGRDAQHRADLETVLAFVERLGALLPDGERPAHIAAALRLRAWLEQQP